MVQSKEEQRHELNSGAWGMPVLLGTPPMAILTELNGTLLESMATAQKEWSEFLHRRIKEDVAVFRELMHSRSLADMHQIYSQYLKTAVEQYRQQSERVAQRGQSVAQHLADSADPAAQERARARH
jgi:beta-phosphoglucomutase-like phosphatase (HAD superfamily)